MFFKVIGVKLSIVFSYDFFSSLAYLSLHLIPVVFIAFFFSPPLTDLSRHWSVIYCLKGPVLLFLFTLLSISLTSKLFPYFGIISILIFF